MRDFSGEMLRGCVRKAMPEKSSVVSKMLRRSLMTEPPKVGSKKYFWVRIQLNHSCCGGTSAGCAHGSALWAWVRSGWSGAVAEAFGIPLASVVAPSSGSIVSTAGVSTDPSLSEIVGITGLAGQPGLGFTGALGWGLKYTCCVTPYCNSSVSLARSTSSKRSTLRSCQCRGSRGR